MISEWDIFYRAQQGNGEAWRKLTENHQPRLLSLALFITGSSSAAEDIVQETFVRAFKARVHNRDGTVKGLLGTIAYRLSIKELKRAQRTERIPEHVEDSKNDSLGTMISDERDKAVGRAVRSLDDKHREVLVLRFYADYSYKEIADLLRISEGTVKSRIFYAVKQCREILKQEGIFE